MQTRLGDTPLTRLKFLPFKSTTGDKRKVTRKRTELALSHGDFFPSEGHASCIVQEQEDQITVFYIGGARRREEASWSISSSIFELTYELEPTDVSVISIHRFNDIKGSQIPPLQSPGLAEHQGKVLLWGGLNLDFLKTENNLIILEPFDQRKTRNYQATVIGIPGSMSKIYQRGDIPTGRTGHSFTKYNDRYIILHGGISMIGRLPGVFTPFQHSPQEGLYIYDIETYTWSVSHLPLPARAYHSANIVTINSSKCVVFIGGICYANGVPSNRLSVADVTVLQPVNDDAGVPSFSSHHYIFSGLSVPMFLSYHGTVALSHHELVVVGGNGNDLPFMDTNNPPKVNSNALYLNFNTKQCMSVVDPFATAGHSVTRLSNDTIVVSGGVEKQFYLLTSKSLIPTPCELGPQCTIEQSPEISPIGWVQCEASCKRWLHLFCIGSLDCGAPKGKYKCTDCSKCKKRRK